MASWLERVGGAVPRGFSRYYILELLKEAPRTGKEVIDSAAEQSGGMWRPSPGLVYPLLGRLLDEGLIEEGGGGRYSITEKGVTTSEDVARVGEAVKRQLDVLARLGGVGRFVVMDALERLAAAGSALGADERERYRKFLESELERVRGPGGREVGID